MTKLTPKQRETLKMLADGWELIWMSGVRCDPYAYMRRGDVEHQTTRVDYVSKFHKLGFIKSVSDQAYSWRSRSYHITDAGRKAIA